MASGLKLVAKDAEDLKVISAVLQDAIIPIGDLAFLPEQRQFLMVANRFRWETAKEDVMSGGASIPDGAAPCGGAPADGGPGEGDAAFLPDEGCGPGEDCPYERTNCAVRFDGVERVATHNLDLRNRAQMLCLLAIDVDEGGDMLLHFSGGGCIRLHAAGVNCRLGDIGEPWPTSRRPCHDAPDHLPSAVAAGS